MKIKCFGKITEIVDREIEINFPITLENLKKILETNFPKLKILDYRIAINDELILEDQQIIHLPNSIALMPPFSGG